MQSCHHDHASWLTSLLNGVCIIICVFVHACHQAMHTAVALIHWGRTSAAKQSKSAEQINFIVFHITQQTAKSRLQYESNPHISHHSGLNVPTWMSQNLIYVAILSAVLYYWQIVSFPLAFSTHVSCMLYRLMTLDAETKRAILSTHCARDTTAKGLQDSKLLFI